MTRSKSILKSKANSSATTPHGKLSMLRRKLKLRAIVQDEKTEQDQLEKNKSLQHEKKKEKPFQRASPMKLIRLYPHMSPKQKDLISRAEFGGLLDIKCSKLQPELCKYLMERFNPTTCEFVFPGRGVIPVTEDSVYVVLGVPWGNKNVVYEIDSDSISFMLKEFGHVGSNQPTMSSIEKKLVSMKNADNTYLRIWSAYAMCSVLAPTTGIHVSPRIYPSLVNIKEASKLNVCKFVIRMLRKAAKSTADKAIQKSCMLYCMVKYLDSLELVDLEVSSTGTRVSVWTNAMVKKAISQDLHPDGTFGRAPLKAEFAAGENSDKFASPTTHDESSLPECNTTPISESKMNATPIQEELGAQLSILFPDSTVFANFVNKNITSTDSTDAKEMCSQAVKEACYSFEKGLQHMIYAFNKPAEREEFHEQRRERIPVVKRKNKPATLEDVIGTQSSGKTETNMKSDQDYDPDEDEEETTDTPVSLDEESYDITKSCSEGKRKSVEANINKRKRECKFPQMPALNSDSDTIVTGGVSSKCERVEVSPACFTPRGDVSTTDTRQHDGNSERSVTTKTGDVIAEETIDVKNLRSPENQVLQSESANEVSNKETDNAPVNESTQLEVSNKETASAHVNESPQLKDGGTMHHQLDPTETLARIGETYKSPSTMISNSDNSDCFGLDASEYTSEGTSNINLFEFVKYSPPPKYKMQKFEVHVFLDMEACTPMKETAQKIISGVSKMDHKDEEQLTWCINGSPSKESKKLLSEMEPSTSIRKRKSVSFASQPELMTNKSTKITASPYRTRAAARIEKAQSPSKDGNPQRRQSPRRMALHNGMDGIQSCTPPPSNVQVSRTKGRTPITPQQEKCNSASDKPAQAASSELEDSMVRRLDFSSSASDKRKEQMHLAPDAPSFDLGFDSQPVSDHGCNNGAQDVKADADPVNSSITPVPHEYNKRIIRAAKFEKSPYVSNKRNFTVTRAANEIYTLVLKHGPKSKSPQRKEEIVDVGDFYVHLGDLADSVAPGEQLVNIIAELGIYIITAQNKNRRKYIMPLRIATYLIDCRFELRDVKKVFTMTATHRLDHKEIICFPTLRSFNNNTDVRPNHSATGHYFLVNLNLLAERFEVMDSITRNGEPLMMEYCHFLVASIKSIWRTEYSSSRIDISNFPIEIIPCPQQTNTYDCGYFMLQILEEWHGGRRVEWFDQKDMSSIRKIFCEKCVRWHENKIKWELVL